MRLKMGDEESGPTPLEMGDETSAQAMPLKEGQKVQALLRPRQHVIHESRKNRIMYGII